MVFCAAPVGRLPELAAAALAAAGPDTVVTDVGSTKRGIVAAVGADERFVGGHPLAGAETAGVANARADLFEGARWYLTPTEQAPTASSTTACSAPSPGSAPVPRRSTPASHDRLMATVSGMPHAVANALVAEAAADLASGERVPEVGPSFRDATRVAGSNPAIWADIFAANSRGGRRLGRRGRPPPRRGRRADPLRRPAAIAAWHAAAGEDRRRLLEAERPDGPLHRAADRRRQPAGDDGDAGAGARRGRRQHRGHGALPGPGHDLRARSRSGSPGTSRPSAAPLWSASWATRVTVVGAGG